MQRWMTFDTIVQLLFWMAFVRWFHRRVLLGARPLTSNRLRRAEIALIVFGSLVALLLFLQLTPYGVLPTAKSAPVLRFLVAFTVVSIVLDWVLVRRVDYAAAEEIAAPIQP